MKKMAFWSLFGLVLTQFYPGCPILVVFLKMTQDNKKKKNGNNGKIKGYDLGVST